MADPPTTPLSRIVIATRNPGKVGELRALLAPAGVEVLGIDEVAPDAPEPEETGTTFEANAAIKARAYAHACGLACLADDSGLEVDALGGAPGVISSHYAWDGRTDGEAACLTRAQRDAANTRRLLAELDGVPEADRTARFACVMALASAAGELIASARGTFEGRIGTPPSVPRGDGGFGYDPVFLVGPDLARTSAELSSAEKNARSHRGAAARAMLAELRRFRLG